MAVSLEDVAVRREYWRGLTATFAHFSLWHIGVNVISLWNLGGLEDALGSPRFAASTVTVVAVNEIVACCLEAALSQSSRRVGFSGVLFAWIVVATLEMPVYCLPFVNVCLPTYQFFGFRVSLAPLAQAFAIQVVIPRASLVGHAAGIIVGFPLAWGLLDVLTAPVLATLLAGIYTAFDDTRTDARATRSRLASTLQVGAGLTLLLQRWRWAPPVPLATFAAALVTGVGAERSLTSRALAGWLAFVHALSFAGLAAALVPVADQTQCYLVRASVSPFTHLTMPGRRSFVVARCRRCIDSHRIQSRRHEFAAQRRRSPRFVYSTRLCLGRPPLLCRRNSLSHNTLFRTWLCAEWKCRRPRADLSTTLAKPFCVSSHLMLTLNPC